MVVQQGGEDLSERLTALIDGDVIVHQAASSAEDKYDWGDGEAPAVVVDFAGAAARARDLVAQWAEAAGCHAVVVALSPDSRSNFRKHILPSYKAARTGRRPAAFDHVLQTLRDTYVTRSVEGLEADDVLGIMHTGQFKGRSVVVSIDKDLKTVPGLHFNPDKDAVRQTVSESEADHRWMLQALMGDSTDGYTGIPGVGPKRATQALGRPRPVNQMWGAVVGAYDKAGLTIEDALVQARVARILRRGDYVKERKEVLLWHPTCPVSLPLETVFGVSSWTPTPVE